MRNLSYRVLILIIFCFVGFHSAKAQTVRYTYESVLSQGKWIKIRVQKDHDVYKLTYEDIKKMGIENPAKVKVYGYGGLILDEVFSNPFIDDLPEVAVWKSTDGELKPGDYILFHNRGTVKVTYDTSKGLFKHQNNPYDSYGYYFLTEGEDGPKVMETEESYDNANTEVTTFQDFTVHEVDNIAFLNSGRELFGESFIGYNSYTYNYSIPGITNDEGKVHISFAAAPTQTETVSLSINNNVLLNKKVNVCKETYKKADLADTIAVWPGNKSSERVSVNISYSGSRGVAHLNFFTLNYTRQLKNYEEFPNTRFRNVANRNKALKYIIDNTNSNCYIWNVSDPTNTKIVNAKRNGNQMSFGAKANSYISEYNIVNTSKAFPTPEFVEVVENRNLHGFEQVDMIIIAPKLYFSYAEQLAQKHEELQGLNVKVVQPEWIYNEFSSGTRDATAYRRFMKMFYDRARLEYKGNAPKYLLLYGDCVFDNRHLSPEVKGLKPENYLLSYQFANSTDERHSYGTDDYFGFLDDSEGASLSSATLDIAIGRLPVSSVTQAKNALEKITYYMEQSNYDNWRNTLIFTADDTGDDSYCVHAKQANELAVYMESTRPEFIVERSYMDAYKPTYNNGQKTYPDAKNKLLNTLKDGCLLVNYTGHGSSVSISAEDMLKINDISEMTFENLPLWITATCDFGWFDGVATSAGEAIFLNKKSGGIALYTTSRVVYSSDNSILNKKIIEYLFPAYGDKFPTLGDALKNAKNAIGTSSNKLNFILLGDPALSLNYPKDKVTLNKILVNNEEVDMSKRINFRALDKVELSGTITDSKGAINTDFNGEVITTIFDGKQTISAETLPSSGSPWSFTNFQNKIYVNNSNVENGEFNFTFRVPLDISYDASNTGKINLYAYNSEMNNDAVGHYLNYTLSGSNEDNDIDGEGPVIENMYLNSANFKDGDSVNETPYFYAAIHSEEGINMAGSAIGHNITICIDNNPNYTYNLNNYYKTNGVSNGWIGFSIPELPEGEHKLVFRVWDILNNSTTDTLTFNISSGHKPKIYDLTAYPNPASDKTTFRLTHDRPETVVDIEIKVFDLTGRTVWTTQQSGNNLYEIDWELENGVGQKVQAGTYIYQAFISTNGSKEATKSKKIIVTKQ
ncbi:hypothetical protein M2138_001019 [Dysgonomonadaceae bacterium PH5-43]|nr:hypothetical protein [Dysgonomonadaceae bacterium PH5-43]